MDEAKAQSFGATAKVIKVVLGAENRAKPVPTANWRNTKLSTVVLVSITTKVAKAMV